MISRKSPFFAFLVVALFFGAARQAHGQLGVAAGLNFDSFDDLEVGSSGATYDNATGYHAGVFYDIGAGVAAVRLGVFYRDLGEVALTVKGGGPEFLFDLNMIEVPVDVRFNLMTTPVVKPYLLVGPVLSFPNTGDDRFTDELKTISVSGTIGAGVAINVGALKLYPEFRYGIGVSRFMDDTLEIGSTTISSENEQRLNTVMLRLGIGF